MARLSIADFGCGLGPFYMRAGERECLGNQERGVEKDRLRPMQAEATFLGEFALANVTLNNSVRRIVRNFILFWVFPVLWGIWIGKCNIGQFSSKNCSQFHSLLGSPGELF